MTFRHNDALARYAVKEEDRKAVDTTLVSGTPGPTTNQKKKLLRPDKNMKLSVSQLCGLDDDGLIGEGLKAVQRRSDGEALYGWLEFNASDVERVGLGVEYDNDPPRHAHVVNWPEESGERRHKGLELASKCMPHSVGSPLAPPNE